MPPVLLYVIRHSPGSNWAPGVPFTEQPNVEHHVGFMRDLLERGLLVLGGPFPDEGGGMAVVRAGSKEEAEALAMEDPSIENGLLRAEVTTWMVPMTSVEPLA